MQAIVEKLAEPRNRALRRAVTIIAGVLLMTLAARTELPFWPVPMTLQDFAVMAFALALGPRASVAILAAYLAAGAVGLPVFAGSPERGVGILYMAGPTGGYLAGMLAASWLVGTLARGRGLLGRAGAMLAGLAVIYAVGVAWLALFVPGAKLLALGVLPFLPGDLVKIAILAVASVVLASGFRRANRRQ